MAMILTSLVILIFSISSMTTWQLVPESPYKCFEHDYPPVDTSATFDDYCKDNYGNLFKPVGSKDQSQLKSCCECLEYQCTYIQYSNILFWNTSVSDHCCLACTNIVYKADTVIETIELDDDCKSIETQVCRKLPGHEKAKIESDFNYKACCNDNTGLQVLGTEVYQPSTCSQRTCFYDKYLPFSLWISKQVLTGCDCCLRYDPKFGNKPYLVADGTTWEKDGRVFECCRGEIVMKMSSSIPFLSNYVVLITGGRSTEDLNVTDHSAEIFLPHTPHIKCTLPGLPAPYFGHTQEDSGLLCGGYTTQTRDNCRQWNSTKGEFPEKPVHKIGGRAFHISLTPSSENDTVLISGLFNPETSTIVRPGIFDGIPGFRVGPLIYACSIHDPDTDTFVITGGEQSLKNTSLFNLEGRIEYLGDLNHGRYQHGCSSYIADDKRIFLVTGGRSTDTTEILMNKNKWTVLPKGNLPGGSIAGLGLATVENNVFAFGGYEIHPYYHDEKKERKKISTLSSILRFNISDGKWYNQSYHMGRSRAFFGISVVDFKYYAHACIERK